MRVTLMAEPTCSAAQRVSEIPLAYGAFCAAYDWCMAAYFYTRRGRWSAAWTARGPVIILP